MQLLLLRVQRPDYTRLQHCCAFWAATEGDVEALQIHGNDLEALYRWVPANAWC